MCNCEKEMAEKLLSHIKSEIEKEPGFQRIEDSYFAHKVFVLSDKGLDTAPIMIPFKVEYSRKAKSGNVRTYKKEINIRPAFCPFCGVKYDK